MKRFMIHLVIAVMVGSTLASCGRDNDYPKAIEPKKEEVAPLKDFTLEKTEVDKDGIPRIYLKVGEKKNIKIISGNGDYEIKEQIISQHIVKVLIFNDNIEIQGLMSDQSTILKIEDVKSKKTIKIIIHITK